MSALDGRNHAVTPTVMGVVSPTALVSAGDTRLIDEAVVRLRKSPHDCGTSPFKQPL